MSADIIEALNCPEYCSGNGVCDISGTGGCLCNENFMGAACEDMIERESHMNKSMPKCYKSTEERYINIRNKSISIL